MEGHPRFAFACTVLWPPVPSRPVTAALLTDGAPRSGSRGALHPHASHAASKPVSTLTAPSSETGAEPGLARRRTPWFAVAAVAVAILSGFVIWSQRHSIDPQVVGRWTRDMRNQSGQWQGRLLIGRDNTYRIETIVKDHGRLVATAGTFRMVSNTQTSAVGS